MSETKQNNQQEDYDVEVLTPAERLEKLAKELEDAEYGQYLSEQSDS